MVVVPIALVLIFGLLYMTYNNVIDAIRVFTGRAVRLDGRHHCVVDSRHAVFHFGGGRLRRAVRRRRAGRHAACFHIRQLRAVASVSNKRSNKPP